MEISKTSRYPYQSEHQKVPLLQYQKNWVYVSAFTLRRMSIWRHFDTEDQQKQNVEEFKKPPEVFSDDDGIKAIDQSNDEDEESFQLYVKTNFPAVFKTFPTEKNNQCYYCDFLPITI